MCLWGTRSCLWGLSGFHLCDGVCCGCRECCAECVQECRGIHCNPACTQAVFGVLASMHTPWLGQLH